jgi:hypothetical protein
VARKYRIERKKSSSVKGTFFTSWPLVDHSLEVKKSFQEGQKEHSSRFNWAKGRVFPSADTCTVTKIFSGRKKEQ